MLLAPLALVVGLSPGLGLRDLEPRAQAHSEVAHQIEVTPVPSDGAKAERVELTIDGQPFATWHLTDQPYLHPVLGPTGKPLTRAYPFEERDGEPRDHPHHRSLWFAHGAVDGLDFWSGVGPLVRPTGLAGHESGTGCGSFELTDDWIAPDGRVVCADRRRLEVFAERDARGIDVDVTLLATDAGLTLGDTKEGTFALRLASGLTVDGSEGRARLTNSEGLQDAAAWGKRARWVLAQGAVDGEPAAVALMDHPQNLRHPTTWHARTYGLLAANPFGLSEFEGAPKGAGDFHLEPGGSLRLRYRVLLFAGVPTSERLDELWNDFASR
jgi:Family of unknown function (DUF6807)